MKGLIAFWKSWFYWRALLIGILMGLMGAMTLWADMRIPLYPQLNVAADVRELFVVLGAWYTGPIGGMLAGAVSALYSPVSDPSLHFSTWLAHTLAGLSLGLVYLPGRTNLAGKHFIVAWARALLTYYLVLVTVVMASISLLVPSFFATMTQPENPLVQGYINFLLAVLPELGFVFVLTAIGLLALPRIYRKPLWDVDKPNNP